DDRGGHAGHEQDDAGRGVGEPERRPEEGQERRERPPGHVEDEGAGREKNEGAGGGGRPGRGEAARWGGGGAGRGARAGGGRAWGGRVGRVIVPSGGRGGGAPGGPACAAGRSSSRVHRPALRLVSWTRSTPMRPRPGAITAGSSR